MSKRKSGQPHSSSRRRRLQIEQVEIRRLLAGDVNIGAVRPDTAFTNNLLAHYLDTQPLATGDANPEITFHYGFSATSNNGVGLQGFNDTALAGDLSGVGYDQSVVVRPLAGALQWLGDTDRDTTQEYLFRFGLADMTPLIADMNGDGIDDAVAVDTTTGSNLLEWYVHYGVPGANPFPTDDSTVGVDATFSFGVDAQHVAAVGGLADIPRVGDINGDGRADVLAVRRGASTKDWFVSFSLGSYPNNTATVLDIHQTITGYGANAAVPVIGDWDNDGDENIGAIDQGSPSTWNLDTNGGGAAEITKQYGLSGDQYIVGQWADVMWDGNQDGDGNGVNWADPDNWSSGVMPLGSNSVVVDQIAPVGPVPAVEFAGLTASVSSLSLRSMALWMNSGSLTVNGPLSSLENIYLVGGSLTLNGTSTALSTSLSNGSLQLNGSLTGPITVGGGATLSGSGTALGPVIVQTTAVVAPGNSPGILNTGNFSLLAGSTLDIELGGLGSNPGVDYDQVNVTGTVSLAGSLDVIRWSDFSFGQNYTIINNDGTDAVSGTFAGLPQGATVQIGDNNFFSISYVGGTGNDVVLSSTSGLRQVGVTTNAGAGSLRQAIADANASPGLDTIVFNITGSGVQTISPTTALPTITGPTIIDGTSQTGYAGSPLIELNGTNAGATADGLVFTTGSAGSVVRGLTINRFGASGIEVDNVAGVIIAGNYIGVNATGASAEGNVVGINIRGGASNAIIGGTIASDRNTIGGNTYGILIEGAGTTNNLVQGNYVGTAANGMMSVANQYGVYVTGAATGTVIGGLTSTPGTEAGNVISGNTNQNVTLHANTTVQGNIIGLAANGDATLGAPIGIGVGAFAGAAGSLIGGPTPQARNVISGNFDAFWAQGFTGITIQNNYIGTDITGMLDRSNQRSTVYDTTAFTVLDNVWVSTPYYTVFGYGDDWVFKGNKFSTNAAGTASIGGGSTSAVLNLGGTNLTVGGTGIGEGNIFGTGLSLQNVVGGTILGNRFGVDSTGNSALANSSYGISMQFSSNFQIGDGTVAGRNLFTNNIAGGYGVSIAGYDTTNNSVRGNWFGTNADGTATLGQIAHGVVISDSAFNNTVADNVIAKATYGLLIDGSRNPNSTGGWFKGNGDLVNNSIYGQPGNIVGTGIGFGTGLAGTQALSFTRTDNGHIYSEHNGSYSGTANSVTLQAWINPNTLPSAGQQYLIAANGDTSAGVNYGLFLTDLGSGPVLRFSYRTSTGQQVADVPITISTGNFTHVAATGDGTNIQFYVNGVSVGTVAIVGTPQMGGTYNVGDPTIRLYIGGGPNAANLTFDGRIEDLVSNVNPLSAAQIARIYSFGGNNLGGSWTRNTTVTGNIIGLLPDGDTPGSVGEGVRIFESETNTIGGSSPAQRNVISGGSSHGILIYGSLAKSNVVLGNYIGTDIAGTADVGNGANGVSIEAGASTNIIGGTTAGARNVISGNSAYGVLVTGAGTIGNTVLGNYIGIDATGTAAMSNNSAGVAVRGGATNNVIGGGAAGAGNVISGNTTASAGVLFSDAGTTGNRVQGNYIGTNSSGTVAVGNLRGVSFYSHATGNYAGTDGDGVDDATEGNVISGNSTGVHYEENADNNTVAGNFIGLNAAGTAAIGNTNEGILIRNDGTLNNIRIGTNSDGVSDAFERNVVSGNSTNIAIQNATDVIVAGNYIGTNAAGTVAIAGSSYGVTATSGSTNVRIGSNGDGVNDAAERNVISGNTHGIIIQSATTSNITVAGNYIGINAAGTGVVANVIGVTINTGAHNNTIGGTTAGARNIISGSTQYGVRLADSGTSANTILGNYIGTDKDGLAALSNSTGVLITDGASTNMIGGTGSSARNVISGNTSAGIRIAVTGTDNNQISANFIGLNALGDAAIDGQTTGIHILAGASGTIIGSPTTPSTPLANVISGNSSDGIWIQSGTNAVRGNAIGTNALGTASISNSIGIKIDGASNQTIDTNILAGNSSTGLTIQGATASGNIVLGNRIGTNLAGTVAIANGTGVFIGSGASNNTIGGLMTTGARNIISGNTQEGILITGTGTSNNVVQGNYIGLDVTGSAALGNNGHGVLIRGGATNNTVGGGQVGARNVISGHTAPLATGVAFIDAGTTGNKVQGNYIGTNSAGTVALGNQLGVMFYSNASGNLAGTDGDGINDVNEGNVISGNHTGVYFQTNADNNVVAGNTIGLDASGTLAVANTFAGVRVFDDSVNNFRIGTNADGISDALERNTITNNSINVYLSGPDGIVAGNYIGTNAAGSAAVGNNAMGVLLATGATNIRIGSNGDGVHDAAERNVISGHSSFGIGISDSDNNTVAGNYVGTDAAGIVAIANITGVEIYGGSTGNTIGGSTVGARNIISGNTSYGVQIVTAGTGNKIQGNYIGTDVTGTSAVGNSAVQLSGAAVRLSSMSGNTVYVGTDGDGTSDATEGNLISGNFGYGVRIQGGNNDTGSHVVAGNLIGVNASGSAALPNQNDGLIIVTSSNNRIGANGDGTSDALEANVISGNRNLGGNPSGAGLVAVGLRILDSITNDALLAASNTIAGNIIGLNALGSAAVANQGYGIVVQDGSSNTIGGILASQRNVISGNTLQGVSMTGAGTTSNFVQGNFIGTDTSGSTAIGNLSGVFIGTGASNNTIGGSSAAMRNVISGNTFDGVTLQDTGTTGNRIQSNYIGTNPTGITAIGNGRAGVFLYSNAASNFVGTDGDSSNDASEGNLISANATGVYLQDNADNNVIAGNKIGVNAAGTTQLGTQTTGIWVFNSTVDGTIIGTDGDGTSDALEGNQIAGNQSNIISSGTGTIVAGNRVGSNSDGTAVIPGSNYGVVVTGSNSRVGYQTLAVESNIIVGANYGVSIGNATASNNVVAGNHIGVLADGVTAGPNTTGVIISTGGHDNTIGGTTAADRNIISGNTSDGIQITGAGTSNNTVAGNYVGTSLDGTAALANGRDGVRIEGGASGNTIGGLAADARNLLSGNTGQGVYILGTGTSNNLVQGNYIGVDVTGSSAIQNNDGVIIGGGATNNIIGGGQTGARNVISGHTAPNARGVLIVDSGMGTTGNKVQGNYIGTNAAGTAAIGNQIGVFFYSASGNTLGVDGDGVNDAGEGNVLSGNNEAGVLLQDNTDNNVIAGNYIGLNAAGNAAIPNAVTGIWAFDSTSENTRIGTNADGVSDALERNVISGNTTYNIYLIASSGLVVAGNYVGTNAAGITAIGGNYGIAVAGGTTNIRIGSNGDGVNDAAEGNVISGHTFGGVQISNLTTSNITVAGNYIGTNATGTAAISNQYGVYIVDGTHNNTIGGTSIGSRNVISGNTVNGVYIYHSRDNTVQGNIIGLNAAGNAALANGQTGVAIAAGSAINPATGNLIGGTVPGARNIISGNTSHGVNLSGANAVGLRIEGNYIGTDITGSIAIGNSSGVTLQGPGAIVGGTAAGAGNLISGNNHGVQFYNSTAGISNPAQSRVQGNIIGLAVDGSTDVGNTTYGVLLALDDRNVLVGGPTTAARNVIGGNDFVQIFTSSTTDGLQIQGNYVGVDSTGLVARTSSSSAVYIQGDNVTVGGTTTTFGSAPGNVILGSLHFADALGGTVQGNILGLGADGSTDPTSSATTGVYLQTSTDVVVGGAGGGNLISGNSGSSGISIDGGGSHIIQSNFIGTDITGTSARANEWGIFVNNGSSNNTIGGTAVGSRNVISGNTSGGIVLTGATTSANVIQGNIVGLDAAGTVALGNVESGVRLSSAGSGNVIGGGAAGARNVISGNLAGSNAGAGIVNSDTSGTIIQGNYIGLDLAGTAAIGNQHFGILSSGGPATIGTNSDGVNDATEGNVIAGNGLAGIQLGGSSNATENVIIAGNFIGTSAAGTAGLGGHSTAGIYLNPSAGVNVRLNRIGTDANGTSDALERNIISGNAGTGVVITGSTATLNTIVGNYIGTNASGTLAIGNGGNGILIENGASDSLIGGLTAPARNVISGNSSSGVFITGAGTTGNVIQGNHIGTDLFGIVPIGNAGPGITVTGGSAIVGGLGAGEANLIAYNSEGVFVTGTSSQATIRKNVIKSNSGLGIDLGVIGVNTNDNGDADSGPNGLQNYPVLSTPVAGAQTRVIGQLNSTPNTTFVIDFYASRVGDPSGFGEAERYLGSIKMTTNLSGLAAFDQLVPGITVSGDLVTAVATDSSGNSSEFSALVGAISTEPPTIDPANLILTEIVSDEGFGDPTVTFAEGSIVRLDGLFSNLDLTDAHTIRVDWGDGSVEEVIVVNPGPRGFTAEYVYNDDRPSATNQDTYLINVFVIDDDNSSGFASIPVTIVNSPALFAGPLTFTPTSLYEGDTGTLSGSFTDPGADTHRLQINWGDGGGIQILALPLGARTFSVPHLFRDNASSISVTILDDDTVGSVLPDTSEINVSIANLPPVATISADSSGIEGVAFTLLASVFDPGIADTQSLVWEIFRNGESLFEAPGGSLTFPPTDDGNYLATVTVTDDEGASRSASHSFVVANASPAITASNLSLKTPSGTEILTASEGRLFELAGSFTDGGIRDLHQVEVDWGDGSPVTPLYLPRGARAFSVPHVYADDFPTGTSIDPMPVVVRVIDNSGAMGSATKVVPIANSAPVVQVLDNGSDDTTVRLRAVVQDDSLMDTFTYSWSVSGVVLPPATPTNQATIEFVRTLTPTFSDNFVQVAVTVTDDDLGSDTAVAVVVLGTNDRDLITVDPTPIPGNITVAVTTGATILTATFPTPETVVVLGRDRDDTIIVNSVLTVNSSIDGGIGNDTITSSSGDDTISGGSGDDSISAGYGNDIIDASVGNDTVLSGDGNDTTKIYDFSDKTLIDSAGIDTIDFAGVSTASIDPANGVSLDLSIADGTRQAVRTGGGVSLTGIYENVIGTSFKDLFVGNSASNLIFGGGDNDSVVSGAGGDDTIDGGSGNDSLSAGGGNDLIFGGIGEDTVMSGSGDESIDGGAGNDMIFGDDLGNDTIIGGSGDDSIEGGAGNDLIFGGDDRDTIISGSGDESIDGGAGNDLIFGAAGGDDTIDGSAGDDSIVGGSGNDLIFGGDDDDTIISGSGDESIHGGEGNDLIFGGDDDGDTIQAGGGDDSIVGGDGNDLIFGAEGDDTIRAGAGDESILGGSGNDLIFGDSLGTDTIDGGSGDDSISAGYGNDLIFGGSGDDTIEAGAGDQSINAGAGNDLIFGDPLSNNSIIDDLIFGGDGNDTVYSGSSDESIIGGNGNDLIFGGDDSGDSVYGGSGEDSIVGGAGNDLIFGGEGNDTIQVGGGDESIDGGAGNDLIFGDATGKDTIIGGGGNDSIHAGTGNDLIFGGSGDDTIQSGAGDQSILGGTGNDLIFGDALGDDTIDGGSGDDSIEGGQGNDLIFGGIGDDTIVAGDGNESIDGGAGNDLIFGGNISDDTVLGGTSTDSILGGDGNDIVFGDDGGADTIDAGAGDDSVIGGEGNDLIFGGVGDDTIRAGSGDESILGGSGNDLIFGGTATDDTIVGGTSDDSIVGGDGNDLIFGDDGGNDTIQGGLGDDSIVGGQGNDLIFGDAHDDTIVGSLGNDSIDGGTGNDLIFAAVETNATLTANTLAVSGQGLLGFTGIERVWLHGNAAPNYIDASAAVIPVMLDGAAGDDSLVGGASDDLLIGGAGNDTLVGSGGNDTYRFNQHAAGHHFINETNSDGEDTLDFGDFVTGVSVDLSSLVAQTVAPGLTLTITGQLENAFGTEYDDSLKGNSLDNKLFGINGSDSLVGGDGNDTLSAGRRRVVFLDFDSGSEVGEHVYTTAERSDIHARMAWDYRMFDIEVTQIRPTVGPYITVAFNAAVINPSNQVTLGGISERIGWRELSGSGTVLVDINGFLGVGSNKLAASSENVIALSSTIGSHELAHTFGLRHQDAFGAPGSGVFVGLGNQNRFRPIYTGPTAAQETRLHLIASPASIRTTLVDALGNPFFGEREALKLAFAESGLVVPETVGSKIATSLGNQPIQVQPLGMLPELAVPNTIEIGINQGVTLTAGAIAVTGAIQLSTSGTSESDYYSFNGTAGDVVTIEVMSQILRHRISNSIDSLLRVYNSAGQKVAYYSSPFGAFSDDSFEPSDSVLIDLVLPATDTYTIEVDTFSFAAPEFSAYAPAGFDVAQFSTNNPNHVAVTDRDTGNYELLIYRFNGTIPVVGNGDRLNGGTGFDILIGNSGKEIIIGFNPSDDTMFDPSGSSKFMSNAPVLQSVAELTGHEASPFSFTAVATDDDGDFSHFSLEAVVGYAFPEGATINPQTGAISFTPSDQGTFKVRVVAHDLAGMTDSQEVLITVLNVDPTVAILGAPASSIEGTAISMTSSANDAAGANDPLSYAWTVTKNGLSYAAGTTDTINFTPNDNGSYLVSLTVSDGDGGSSTDSKTIQVTNANPTVTLSGPTESTVGLEVKVVSTASDPAGASDPLSYAWVITSNGNPFAVQTGGATYAFVPSLAGAYEVSLTVTDDDGGSVTQSHSLVVTGVNHAPVVTIQTSVDGIVGEPSLFTFTATDVDTIDQSGSFVYFINWGDGTTSTVTGNSSMTISHTYAGVSSTGTFKITASVQDARGAVSQEATESFAVLGWSVMIDPIHPGQAIFVVSGSKGKDDIKIWDKQGDFLRVKIRDRDELVRYKGTVFGDVQRILVFGLAGDDKITIDDDINVDAHIWGGSGADQIKAGSGNDIIFGEAGDDKLYGGNGRDILIGGTGQDRIHGDGHDDILIGGFTAFDQEFNQLAPINIFPPTSRLSFNDQRLAIEAIMAEWASNRSYAQRRANISGSGTGPRNNGTTYLRFDESIIANNTVFDDGVVDTIWGDSGTDWFLANSDGPLNSRDDIKDRTGNEVLSDTDRWW